jgi:hypothetical protein
MSIYVGTCIHGPLEEVWRRTQDPDEHKKWDLRFTQIEYLPRPDSSQPQRFRYSTRIGFGIAISGEGETVGTQADRDGPRTSALRFWSDDPKSLIQDGSGYWQYVPTSDGVCFLTAYDYRVRFGFIGRVVDRVFFRPLMTWATAWSFDRLRLWIERRIEPSESLRLTLIHATARLAIACAWLYQGLAPKLFHQSADELAMLSDVGFTGGAALLCLWFLGWGEVVFGLSLLVAPRATWHFVATIVLMAAATLSVALASPRFLVSAFNPVSVNLLVTALAAVGLTAGRNLPSARHCRLSRRKEKEQP